MWSRFGLVAYKSCNELYMHDHHNDSDDGGCHILSRDY